MSLHPRLRDDIQYPEYRMLYDSKIRLSDPVLYKSVIACIKNIRNKYNSRNACDILHQKSQRFKKPGDWAKAKIQELEKVIYDETKSVPATDQGQWRSIEFELIFNNEAAMIDFARQVRVNKCSKFVTIKHDGSLRVDEDDRNGGLCKEVVLTYQKGNEEIVRTICSALKGRAYVNNSCGTHVHFDMRNADEKTARQYGTRVARCVPALRTILPKCRRTSKYCANPINGFHGSNNERYSFVNMQAYTKYQTIEIRGHSGTLRADKILNWIAVCEKIMTTRIRAKTGEIIDPMELIRIYKFEPAIADYIRDRYKRYNLLDKDVIPAAVDAPPAV